MNSIIKKPLISVVLCTCNGSKYIKEAIDSILAQTFTNFEFIIWNDGSTDSTEEIVKSYSDDRIRYFSHENTGLGMALYLACNEARGKYIARMDDDDISLPKRLEREISYLEAHPECVLVSSAVLFIDEKGEVQGRSFPCTSDKILRGVISVNNMIVHPMVMMRREDYIKAGGYVPIRTAQDRVTWSRLAKYGKFANIETPLGKYRQLESSISHMYNPYFGVIYEMRSKMIQDDLILNTDIDLYNHLCLYSKQHLKKGESRKANLNGWDEKAFDVLTRFFDEKIIEKLIAYIKNKYFMYKYRNVIR